MFLLKFDERDPESKKFIINWKNKLDIDDVNMFFLCGDNQQNPETAIKELVISYKTIFVNTFNVVVLNLANQTK